MPKGPVRVLTDTTAALPEDLASRWGITLVPLTLIVGGRPYRDGELAPGDLTGKVSTSGPPPGEFLRQLPGPDADAVIVTVGRRLSSTHRAAVIAARMTPGAVEVIDSGSAAGGQALVALAAARRARQGGGLAEVAAAARDAAAEVKVIGCLESLDGLARSGRVPGLAATAMRRSGLHFLFELHAGRIRPLRPASGQEAALLRIVRACHAEAVPGGRVDVIVLDSGSPEPADRLRALLKERLPVRNELTGTFGSAMIVHAGTGVTGLAWHWQPADDSDD